MHILTIPSWYMTPDNRHRGIAYYEQAQAFRKRGHKMGFIVPPSRFRTWHGLNEFWHYKGKRNTVLSIEDDNGIPTYRIPWWGWIPSVIVPARQKIILYAFDTYCQEQGTPDIIHARSFLYGGFAAAVIGANRNVPALMTETASIFADGALLPDHLLAVRYTVARLNKILAISESIKEQIHSFTGNREVTVVYNPVDTELFTLAAAPPPPNPFIFLIIGNLVRLKGHHILLSAFQQVFENSRQAHLHIIGDGKERANLEKQVRRLNLQAGVTFHGRLPREKVRDKIQQTHVVMSVSRVETFGMTLIEAAACGKPVIATRCGGPESIVKAETGILVDYGDVDALAAAMQQMINHYDQYNPQTIRADCMAQFGHDTYINRLEDIYKDLIRSKNHVDSR